jgi:nucleoside-diphosphate-sugar epimerase
MSVNTPFARVLVTGGAGFMLGQLIDGLQEEYRILISSS